MLRAGLFALVLLAALSAAGPGCAPAEEAPAPSAASASRAPALEPFEDLPREESAAPARSGAQTPFSAEPEESAVWKRALARAAEAEVFYAAAEEAHRAGDRATLNEQGREARVLFDRALEDTAVFEEEITATHGEQDPAVQRIVRTRNGWFDRTRWLHKSIGR